MSHRTQANLPRLSALSLCVALASIGCGNSPTESEAFQASPPTKTLNTRDRVKESAWRMFERIKEQAFLSHTAEELEESIVELEERVGHWQHYKRLHSIDLEDLVQASRDFIGKQRVRLNVLRAAEIA